MTEKLSVPPSPDPALRWAASQGTGLSAVTYQPQPPWYQTVPAKTFRWVVAVLATLVAVGLGALGFLSDWFTNYIADTDTFVDVLEPLQSSLELKAALTDRAGQAVEQYVKDTAIVTSLEGWADSADKFANLLGVGGTLDLSGALDSATTALAEFARETAETEVENFLISPDFPQVFRTTLEDIHSQVVGIIAEPGTPRDASVTVTLDTSSIVDEVLSQAASTAPIVHQHLTLAVDTDMELFQLEDVGAKHAWYMLLNENSSRYFTAALLTFGVALAVAPRRWLTIALAGTTVTVVAWYFATQIRTYASSAVAGPHTDLTAVILQASDLLATPLTTRFLQVVWVGAAVVGLGFLGLGATALVRRQWIEGNGIGKRPRPQPPGGRSA